MAKDRVIQIGVDLDTSGMLSGINQMRKMLGDINVDSNLFKDVNKDLDKITTLITSMNSMLKNGGLSEKDIKPLLKDLDSASKIYTNLPNKIRQVAIATNNIRFPSEALDRLDEIQLEIDVLKDKAKKALGSDLQKALRNAIPTDLIDDKVLTNITKAEDKANSFVDTVKNIKNAARDSRKELDVLVTSLSNPKAIPANASDRVRTQLMAENQSAAGFSRLLSQSLNNNTLEQDKDTLGQLYSTLGRTPKQLSDFITKIDEYVAAEKRANEIDNIRKQVLDIISNANLSAADTTARITQLIQEQNTIERDAVEESTKAKEKAANATEELADTSVQAMKATGDSVERANTHIQKQDSLLKQLASRATSLIGIGAVFNYITRGIHDAWNGIRELDKEFTQIAVVTDKTTSQLWQSFGTYSQMAQALGVATKDAVATSALYYQQGLDTADVMTLTAETIKMAQIAGMDFATATNQMTAAIRGFNLEMSDASKVNDIFSTLAANAAVSTQELSYALTKTASIAESAGMSIDTTSAFLTKMIETTREAPENIGTAMKSIVARFEELKKNPLALSVDVEGEEVVANKVEAAIALAGVKLRDTTTGQFRDLDEVFLELAKSWENLDRNTQRYIATIAAGSRQQSRFIALMDGYDRTLELTEIAQDSEGQSAAQFLKTLDSLDSKLNKVRNSLEQLYQKFVDSDLFGGLLTGLNNFLQSLGKLDAGSLASIAAIGMVIVNTLINTIKTGAPEFVQVGSIIAQQLGKGFSEKFDNTLGKTKIGSMLSPRSSGQKWVTKQKDKAKQEKSQIIDKYNIDVTEAKKSLADLNQQRAKLTSELKNAKDNNLTIQTNQLQKDLDVVKDKARAAANNLKNLRNNDPTQGINEELNKTYDEIEKNGQERIAQLEKNLGPAIRAAGTGLVTGLAASITTALNGGDFSTTILSGLSMVAISTVPQLVSSFMSAAGPAMLEAGGTLGNMLGAGMEAGLAATGVGLVIAAVAAAIVAVVAGIAWAATNIKSNSQQLQEEIDALKEKQKELDETAERSQAEAAVSKTSYNKLTKLIQKYDNLDEKISKTTEEQEEFKTIQDDLAKEFPDLVWYYDEAGNAVLKQREEWEKIVELQQESTKLALSGAATDRINAALNEKTTAEKQQELDNITLQSNLKTTIGDRSGYNVSSIYSREELKQQLQKNFTNEDVIDIGQFLGNSEFKITASDRNAKVFNELIDNSINGTITDNIESLVQKLDIDDNQKERLINQVSTDTSNFFDDIASLAEDLSLVEQDLTPAQQKAKQAEQKALNAIANYYENYINSFVPKEQIEDFSKVGINRLTQGFAKETKQQSLDDIIQSSDFWDKAIKSGALSEDKARILKSDYKQEAAKTPQLLKDLGWKNQTAENIVSEQVDLSKVGDKELLSELEEIAKVVSSFNLDEQAQKVTDTLPQIQSLLSEEEFSLFNTDDLGNLSSEQMDSLKSIYDKIKENNVLDFGWEEAIGQELTNIETRVNQWSPNLQQFAHNFNANLAEAISKSGAGDTQIQALNNIFKGYSTDQVAGLTNIITNINWGDAGNLKQLAQELMKCGDSAEEAVDKTLQLKEVLNDPIDLTLNADKAIEDVTKVAESLTDLKKGLKDLNAAVQEYNENGRLSGETILDLVANGQLMYLNYDEQTKAITINKDAMVDYYNAQVAQAKLNLELKKTEVEQSIATLKQRKINLEAQLKILKTAQSQEGKLTAEQYKALDILNNTYDQNTLTNTNKFLDDLLSQYATAMKELAGIMAQGGAQAKNAFMASMTGQDFSIEAIDLSGTKQRLQEIIDGATYLDARYHGNYRYQLDEAAVQEAIDSLSEEIKNTEEFIKAQEAYRDSINKGLDITTRLTESGLDKFMNDTAKAASDAKKELEDYVSTLEKYYTLQKQIEKSEKDRQKTLKQYKKTGDTKYLQQYISESENTLKKKGQLAYVGRTEKDVSMATAKTKLASYFTADELKQLQFDSATGLVDYDKFRETQAYKSKTQDDKQGKEIEDILKTLFSDVEKYQGWIDDYDDFAISYQEELEDLKKEAEKIAKSINRLQNINQAMESIKEVLEEAKDLNEEYFASGGREGIGAMQYLKTQAEGINSENLAQGEYKKLQAEYVKELTDKGFDQYIDKTSPDGKIYYKQGYAKELLAQGTAGQEQLESLQDLVGKYNELTDAVEDSEKAQRESAKAMREYARSLKKSYSDLITRVADDMAALDQKQIDEVKKKYAMIQEEDDKYLDALQKSIDKQRQLRDQAKSYDDLEKQEKRLALLERDTSGANAAEIAALKEQIKDARQNLVDTEQDNIVNNISEANTLRKDKMDEETTFLQNVMDERTYDMQYYLDKARDIVDAAINGDAGAYQQMLEIMQEAESEFYRVTREAQDEWLQSLTEDYEKSKGWVEIVSAGYDAITNETINHIKDISTTMAESDHGASELSNKIDQINKNINVIEGADPFKILNANLDTAIDKIKTLQEEIANGKYDIEIPIVYKATGDVSGGDSYAGYSSGGTNNSEKHALTMTPDTATLERFKNEWKDTHKEWYAQQISTSENAPTANEGSNNEKHSTFSWDEYIAQQGWNYGEKSLYDENPNFEQYYILDSKNNILTQEADRTIASNYQKALLEKYNGRFDVITGAELWQRLMWNKEKFYKRYANGGLVNYTGPAWVDGTSTSPEAFLSADDTRNFQELAKILQSVLNFDKAPVATTEKDKIQIKSGDTNIEIHIEVDKIDSEESMEELCEMMADKIQQSYSGGISQP